MDRAQRAGKRDGVAVVIAGAILLLLFFYLMQSGTPSRDRVREDRTTTTGRSPKERFRERQIRGLP